MVSSKERLKLIQQYRHEPVCTYGVLIRAAAGLLFIAISAVIGVTSRSGSDSDSPRVEVQRYDRAAASASRKLYEERRARFETRQSEPAPSALMSGVQAEGSPAILPAAVHRTDPAFSVE
jgi:hypothetical protein